MTTRQAPPLNRANAEAILTGTATERSELAQIIAAARGPATSDELAGEAAAMIRFQAARLEPAAAHGVTVRKRMSDKLLAAKLGIAAALAAAATGGVALAAAAHTQTEPAHHALPASTSVAAPSHDGTPTPGNQGGRTTPPPPPSHAATASAAPPAPGGARLAPLGVSFAVAAWPVHRVLRNRRYRMESVIDNPAFRALVTAAGGKGKVTTYCQTLLRADPYPTRPARSYSSGRRSSGPAKRHRPPPQRLTRRATQRGEGRPILTGLRPINSRRSAPAERPRPGSAREINRGPVVD